MNKVMEMMMEMKQMDALDEEATRMIERMVIIRLSTKHINLWIRQLDMKRKEIAELAELIGFEGIQKEVETERSLERWARRSTNCFTKKVKRMVYEETDNMVWNDGQNEIVRWCRKNKVYDEITEEEIEEIWKRIPRGRGSEIEWQIRLGDGKTRV